VDIRSATLRNLDEATRAFFLSRSFISGAEDPAGAVAPTITDPATPDPSTTPPDPATTDPEPVMPPPADGKTYTQDEVNKFVEESKKYRQRAQAAEKKLSDHEKAQMTEKERAEANAKEAITRAEAAEAELSRLRLERAVESEASAQNFTTPADVMAFLDIKSLKLDDDGKPDTNSLKAAVKRVATEKPYLIKGAGGAGSADGGARGGHQTDKSADYKKEYQDRGMVPIG
jgi:hypothetical protein